MKRVEAMSQALGSRILQLAGLFWSGIFYLLEPDAAFMAVWIAVLMDLLTKLASIAANKGGLVNAVMQGHISSRRAFFGTFVKLTSYFALGVIANQAKYVAQVDVATILARTVVFSFLFTVEAVSILENLLAMGLSELAPLLNAVRKARR